MYHDTAERRLAKLAADGVRAQLIFTSPPFILNAKKKYGNLQGQEYVDWMARLAPLFMDVLAPDGSIVIELGNAWERGHPVMSTLALRALLSFLDSGDLHLCQQFVVHNPAKLPTPAQWVTVERVRVRDSFTHAWWMSPVPRPKADNRRVLKPYSKRQQQLLERQDYNAGRRPSGHVIGDTSFLKDNGGAIPPSVLTISNTRSSDEYTRYCEARGLPLHPARMPAALAEFFIRFLTEPDDLVLDPFAGSNTTGAVAEREGRRWIGIDADYNYVEGSRGRFKTIQEGRRRADLAS